MYQFWRIILAQDTSKHAWIHYVGPLLRRHLLSRPQTMVSEKRNIYIVRSLVAPLCKTLHSFTIIGHRRAESKYQIVAEWQMRKGETRAILERSEKIILLLLFVRFTYSLACAGLVGVRPPRQTDAVLGLLTLASVYLFSVFGQYQFLYSWW